ncbi:MAG: tetratricopeptide repeat protein, partial [Planctomycetes bacterium]|nr:tetratricopeptide repeat protein [Planctomycetota bacterium]
RRLFHILPIVLVSSAYPEPLPDSPGHVNSRTIIISCQSANGADIDQIHLWVSVDDAQAWQRAEASRTGPNTVRFHAPSDGNYRFYIVLENGAGQSAAPPASESEPHLRVAVDTAPPTLQIHSARPTPAPDGSVRVDLDVSLVDEYVGEAGTRLFYRANADAGWQDAGSVIPVGSIITWRPPAGIPNRIDIRVAATDLAGNRTVDEIRDVTLDRVDVVVPPRAEATPSPGLDPLPVLAVEPVTVAPVPPVALADEPQPTAATQPVPQQVTQSELLHAQGARFLAEGRLALAGARFYEALELTPDDVDLQVDLGSVLFRTGQYDQAAVRFQRVLDVHPDHLGAIEGVALVAVNQKRYPDARSHLEHLLRLRPDAAEHWLHFGDVEHVLGNVVDARAAWRKVLQLEPADETIREKAHERLRLFGQSRPSAK